VIVAGKFPSEGKEKSNRPGTEEPSTGVGGGSQVIGGGGLHLKKIFMGREA